MSLKSLKSKSDLALASISADVSSEARPQRATTAPGAAAFMQPTIDALNDRAKSAEARVEALKLQLEQRPVDLDLDLLVEVPHRRRRLTPEQFEELKGNLASNPLVHPISVIRRVDGRFEIVSGHNRVDAYRALGRSLIPVVVMDLEDAEADRSAFYANLLQPSLPDYEKFLGFKREKESRNLTQKQLAREAGVSESMVSMLFAFEQLGEGVRDLIERRTDAIGMNCAAELAKLVRDGHEASVKEAVGLLIDGQLTQKDAVRHVMRAALPPRVKVSSSAPTRIKVGRLEYCQFQGRANVLRIDFKSEEQRQEAEAALREVLQKLAEQAVAP